jgi:hypothetical protein
LFDCSITSQQNYNLAVIMGRYITFLLICVLALALLPSPVAAFGAGNIASISKIEGHNWRHGDIEDMLKAVAFIRGHKWTAMMIKRSKIEKLVLSKFNTDSVQLTLATGFATTPRLWTLEH